MPVFRLVISKTVKRPLLLNMGFILVNLHDILACKGIIVSVLANVVPEWLLLVVNRLDLLYAVFNLPL